MRFSIVTLFPHLIESYFSDSIHRAIEQGLIGVDFVNPRDFSPHRFAKTDDYQVGGGAGLVLEPLALSNALDFVKKESQNAHYFSYTLCETLFTK